MSCVRDRRRLVTVAALLASALLLLVVAEAEARRIRPPRKRGPWIVGHVVSVTQRYVYVDLGQRHGLKRGDTVQLRLRRRWRLSLQLEQVGPSSARAALPVGGLVPPRRALARARWRAPVAGSVKARRKARKAPLPSERLDELWQGVDRDRPKLVAYKGRRKKGRAAGRAPRRKQTELRGSFGLSYGGLFDLGDSTPQASYHQLDLFSALDARGLLFRWLGYSHRIGLRLPFARDLDLRPFQNSRPKIRVQRLALGFALPRARLSLGRIDGAPTPDAGMVDGGAVRVRVGRGVYLGAFGGLSPGLDDLLPQTTASRFGVYSSLRMAPRGHRRWSLAADVGALGTTFAESLDRKALSGQLAFRYGSFDVDARFVLDLYSADHPSGLEGLDPSLISARVAARPARRVSFALAYDHYRLVPSRELLALGLPKDDAVDSSRANLDLLLGRATTLSLDGGFTWQSEASWIAWAQLGGAKSQLLGETDLLRVFFQASRGNIFDSLGGRVSYGLELVAGLDAALAYGLYADSYRDQDASSLRHSGSMTLDLVIGRGWLVTLDSVLQVSDEERVLSLIATSAFSF